MAHLNEVQKKRLSELLKSARLRSKMSMREVARRARVDPATIVRLEQGNNPNPTIENLSAIAEVIGIPTADIFALTKVLRKDELPSFTPYLRAKYQDLAEADIAEMEAYFQQIAKRHRISPDGPHPGEDE
ncbi:MAG: helix-turn-helix domain-containing protein [Nakamurella sp.]